MGNEKKDGGFIQGILNAMEDVANESQEQAELYQEFSDKTKYYHKNLSGLYEEAKYWSDTDRVNKDQMIIKQLEYERNTMMKRYRRAWILIAVV